MFGDALAFYLVGSAVLIIVGLVIAMLTTFMLLSKNNTKAEKVVGAVLLNIIVAAIAMVFVKSIAMLMLGGGR